MFEKQVYITGKKEYNSSIFENIILSRSITIKFTQKQFSEFLLYSEKFLKISLNTKQVFEFLKEPKNFDQIFFCINFEINEIIFLIDEQYNFIDQCTLTPELFSYSFPYESNLLILSEISNILFEAKQILENNFL